MQIRPLKSRMMLDRLFPIAAILFYVWFIVHSLVACHHGLRTDTADGDVAIVYGGYVHPGGIPAFSTSRRIAKALELYSEGRVDYLLVSGGDLRGERNEGATMARELRRAGVPDTAIIVDTTAVSTFETARVARRVIRKWGFRSPVIVTSYYHILRARLALSRFGITGAGAAYATISWEKDHPWLFFRPGLWWHEFAGFYWYLVRPLWWEG